MYEIRAVRAAWSDDYSHEHLDLVGYESPHTPGEPITVPVQRVIQKMALGEDYGVRIDDELVEVKPGKCPVCGHEPNLVTAKDSKERAHLLELRRI